MVEEFSAFVESHTCANRLILPKAKRCAVEEWPKKFLLRNEEFLPCVQGLYGYLSRDGQELTEHIFLSLGRQLKNAGERRRSM